MKKAIAFVFLLTCISSMAGCGSLGSGSDETVLKTNLTTDDFMYGLETWPCYDLSSSGPVQASDFVQGPGTFFVPSLVATNSHKITVSNQSGADVVIYLFSEGGASGPIRQMAVANHEEGSFVGLTSRFLYTIGIASDVSTKLDITITD